MPSDLAAAAAIGAAIIAGAVAMITTRITQKELARRRELDELAKLVADFAASLSSVLYSFLWITWCAKYENALDDPTMEQYWREIHQAMPRVYGGYVMVASVDATIGLVARKLLDEAENLDLEIGNATPDTSNKSVQ